VRCARDLRLEDLGEGEAWCCERRRGTARPALAWRSCLRFGGDEVSTAITGRPEAIDLDQAAGPPRLGGRERLSSMEEVCNLLYRTGYQKTAYVGAFGRFLINLVRFCRTI
jgi:hypothetical protein